MPRVIGVVAASSLLRMVAPATAAYFAVLDEDSDGGRYRASEATGGPWNAGLQHGGPPSALVVRAAERLAEQKLMRRDLQAVRLAADFVGPVPVAELTVNAELVRAARSAVLVNVSVSAAERPCLHGRVWLTRTSDTSAIAPPPRAPEPIPGDPPDFGAQFPYGNTIEWRTLTGAMSQPGPGRTWARPRYRIVGAEPMSGLQRVVLIGDSSSGISAELDWAAWTFLNIDLDVHLSRPVEGEWVLVEAATTLGTAGAALARSTVSDVRGEVGCTAQTLVLSQRTGRSSQLQ